MVLEAVTAKGVKLDSNTLHALLRMLHCRPARFVKLGLVEDVKAARQAYKLGGRACAKEWFRNKGGHGKGGKGWGRGLHGRGRCHGRGAGWAFEVSMEEEHHWGRRGGHGKRLPRAPLALARGPRLPRQGPRPRSPVGQGRGRGPRRPRSPVGPASAAAGVAAAPRPAGLRPLVERCALPEARGDTRRPRHSPSFRTR